MREKHLLERSRLSHSAQGVRGASLQTKKRKERKHSEASSNRCRADMVPRAADYCRRRWGATQTVQQLIRQLQYFEAQGVILRISAHLLVAQLFFGQELVSSCFFVLDFLSFFLVLLFLVLIFFFLDSILLLLLLFLGLSGLLLHRLKFCFALPWEGRLAITASCVALPTPSVS